MDMQPIPASFTYRRLVLDRGLVTKRKFTPNPALLAPLAELRADGGYVRLAAPMDGYGLALEPGSDADGGAFRVFLERGGMPRQCSACVYCAAGPEAERRFDEAIEACRQAAMDGRVPRLPRVLRRPRQTPWLAVLDLDQPEPEAELLEDAVFMILAVGPQPAAGSSRGLPERL